MLQSAEKYFKVVTLTHDHEIRPLGKLLERSSGNALELLKMLEFYMIFIICHLQPVCNELGGSF